MTMEEAQELELPLRGDFPSGRVQPCVLSFSMGDAKGVPCAQEGMTEVGSRAGLDRWELLQLDSPAPPGSLWATVCIDDVIMQKDLGAEDGGDRNDERIGKRLREELTKLGIPPKESKVWEKVKEIVGLGAQQNGVSGRCGARLSAIAQLMMLNLLFLKVRRGTRKAVEKLTGHWGHAALYRRDAFCLIDELYKEGKERKATKVDWLSRGSLEELLMLLLSAPGVRVNMKLWSPRFLVANFQSLQHKQKHIQ